MTFEALISALASLPMVSLVIDEVTTIQLDVRCGRSLPPPRGSLRALIFMSSLPLGGCCRCKQRLHLLLAEVDVIELPIKSAIAVEEKVGNLRFLLHAVGKRHVGRADAATVYDEVRFKLEDIFEVGGTASAREATLLGKLADALVKKWPLGGSWHPHPADHFLGRKRVEEDRRRRAGSKNTCDRARHLHATPSRIRDDARGLLRLRRMPGISQQKRAEAAKSADDLTAPEHAHSRSLDNGAISGGI